MSIWTAYIWRLTHSDAWSLFFAPFVRVSVAWTDSAQQALLQAVKATRTTLLTQISSKVKLFEGILGNGSGTPRSSDDSTSETKLSTASRSQVQDADATDTLRVQMTDVVDVLFLAYLNRLNSSIPSKLSLESWTRYAADILSETEAQAPFLPQDDAEKRRVETSLFSSAMKRTQNAFLLWMNSVLMWSLVLPAWFLSRLGLNGLQRMQARTIRYSNFENAW